MNKSICSISLCLVFTCSLFGQVTNFTKEINEQVWIPFISSFSSGDDEGFKKVHSKDVIRVEQDAGRIFGYDVYFKKMPDSVKNKWSAWKKNIELRFTQRIASETNAFHVGYYNTTSTNSKTGEVRNSFGKFHVLMKKENGVWKILLDADTGEGANEEVFNKAEKM